MQCGEKDPFVDDTVIFAGRVREAKRARKAELDLAIAGKSARFGEGLRMTESRTSGSTEALAALKKERDQLAQESEDDWVQMVLFSDWSHGYLQMPTLMAEARAVIDELGDWIDDAFGRYARDGKSDPTGAADMMGVKKANSPLFGPQVGSASPSPFNSETEDDSSTAITFAPRRNQGRQPPIHFDNDGLTSSPEVGTQSSSGSDATLLDEHDKRHPLNDEGKLKAETVGFDEEQSEHATRAGTPTKPATPVKTVTETELMRRRRLLDSHIFD
jgi:hypothetical protein